MARSFGSSASAVACSIIARGLIPGLRSVILAEEGTKPNKGFVRTAARWFSVLGVVAAAMGELVEALFLPPYSPDFSPIEEAFLKIKGLGAVRAEEDARGFFGHRGGTGCRVRFRYKPL